MSTDHSAPDPDALRLRCSSCGRTYTDRWRCACGHPLDIDAPLPDTAEIDPETIDLTAGLWGFDALLALPARQRVCLGAGATPLVTAPEPWSCQFMLEYVSPTGSFKDRGAAAVLSRAVELGVDRVIEDSSGNAGAAIATYAARAGLDCTVYVPASAPSAKVRAIERTGASIVRVEGSRQDVTDACVAAVERGEGWYASHAWNPFFFEGTATIAYEIAARRGWSAPDALLMPLGHGTLFLGAYRGFRRLDQMDLIDELPRLLGVQAAGYDPIARELHGAADGDTNDAADGIHIREPVRKNQIMDAIAATDGDCIALGSTAVEAELGALGRHGFYVEPTSAIAPAALERYRERGVLDPDDDVVVPLTGSGLKK
ncbi:pyridoxal-phosphate dependent enzyme [Halocatena pleomorpha]|uniref:Pyridoxal-phosphate dependent enzyme n=1 Tax=Halocatena pleomorpha TaxID=1785090 RepID=A0A3P3RJU4_9EURY|nr:pyridoxal-phosphate dependent enzyme [Halocatena pleomorpha]RRJ33110.1 pyridoxal-phosphate dependent enzyme [Halocatena pleomorpha]